MFESNHLLFLFLSVLNSALLAAALGVVVWAVRDRRREKAQEAKRSSATATSKTTRLPAKKIENAALNAPKTAEAQKRAS